ncbi:MAG TPA: PRC-barrel domain-containing protein [Longimicrobiales bacterium]|nr:PRC-barrel domain-containing protein [Longimicrobiales bacterium]
MAKDKRARRDQAGVGPDPVTRRGKLVPMAALEGYTLGDGEPDIRGWTVCTLGGRDLGEVEDLLIDPERGEVVMLEVDMRGEGVHAEVPIRAVQLDRKDKRVLVDSGDLDTRNDVRARDRFSETDRERTKEEFHEAPRDVRYEATEDMERTIDEDGVEETVIERRPVVEEVVVRRRVVE